MIPKLTASGKNLLLRALAGENITFTRIQLGNGPAQDPVAASALVNPILTIELSKIEVGQEYVTLTASFTNGSIKSGFHITEAGFFAKDPDDNTKEILYAIGNEDESSADYVPDSSSRIFEMQFDALIFIGDAENVSAAISSSLVYASKDEFNAHTADNSNPHAVTKAQVGLGKVPNVSTNDQTPTFTETTTLATINSGEKLSVLFGKIKLAITKLIAHINNRNNPHSCTASQVGAAAKSHTHNTQDINAGILPTNRGGTGLQIEGNFFKAVKDSVFLASEYFGDGTQGRFIDLGFTPRAVLVCAAEGVVEKSYEVLLYRSGLAIWGSNAVIHGAGENSIAKWNNEEGVVGIVQDGFLVNTFSYNNIHTNDADKWYHFIALK